MTSQCPTPRTYFVLSPEIFLGGGWDEPPEHGPAVQEVMASSKRGAISYAVRHPNSQIERWVQDARSIGRTPFAGLTAEHPHCEHGACLDLGDPVEVCAGCKREDHEQVEQIKREQREAGMSA